MRELDACAHTNAWRRLHPAEKCLFATLLLSAALIARTPWVPLLVGLTASAAALLGARVPPRLFGRFLTVPVSFLALSCVALAVSLPGVQAADVAIALPFGLAVTHAGLAEAVLAFCRSLGAVCALLLLGFTTPMTDIVAVLHRLHVPVVLLDLMTLAYRQIFVLSDDVRRVRRAQTARLGYDTLATTRASLGSLGGRVLVSTFERSHASYVGLLARGYEGDLRFLPAQYRWSALNILMGGAIGGALIAVAAVLR